MKSLKNLRIVFMGTPEFAVASLDKLLGAGYNIVGVVTAPDKPAGRGMQHTESAVKKYAISKGIHILQPEKLKDPVFLEELRSLNADLQVVVAFRMLPEIVWAMPPLGTVNLHGSLLPDYRGAAPINWAIINGEKVTGVTTFKLQQEIDTGDILLSKTVNIGEDENAGQLHDRMKEVGASLLVKTVKEIAEGTAREIPQSGLTNATPGEYKHAPKIFTETCVINWNNTVEKIYDLTRGLSPYPAAFTMLDGKKLKIFEAKKEVTAPQISAGNYLTDHKTYLKFACTNGYISITSLQLEGKRRMSVEEFLRGYKFATGTTNTPPLT